LAPTSMPSYGLIKSSSKQGFGRGGASLRATVRPMPRNRCTGPPATLGNMRAQGVFPFQVRRPQAGSGARGGLWVLARSARGFMHSAGDRWYWPRVRYRLPPLKSAPFTRSARRPLGDSGTEALARGPEENRSRLKQPLRLKAFWADPEIALGGMLSQASAKLAPVPRDLSRVSVGYTARAISHAPP